MLQEQGYEEQDQDQPETGMVENLENENEDQTEQQTYESQAKRLKTDEDDEAAAAYSAPEENERRNQRDGGGIHHKVSVSPVVHVRGLCESVVEADLTEALQRFGTISYVMMMPFKRQALVEFENTDFAQACVSTTANEAVYIAGQQAYFNFSTSKRITRPANADDPSGGNKVLLFSIQNPLYPITVEVLHAVCSPVAKVMRIVTFKRNGVQAMVEFENLLGAQKAKSSLNGADIYAGCCTLKIEYARPTRLNVIKNDSETWDYTRPFLSKPGPEKGKGRPKQAILGDHPTSHLQSYGSPPSYGSSFGPYGGSYDYGSSYGSSYGFDGYGSQQAPLLPLPNRHKMDSRDTPELVSYPLPQSSSNYMYRSHLSGSVAMVGGLHPPKMNCSRAFNLFCLYGNVEKIKYMKSIPGSALIEMGDDYAVERAITHLDNIKLFGTKLTVCVSKQHSVIPSQVFELEDGSSSFKDFSTSKNNRFTSAGQVSKNVIQPPSCVLHFYNVPLTVNEDTFQKMCEENDVPMFIKCKVFDARPTAKTLSGLLAWESKTQAVEALAILNHNQIRVSNGANPYTLKLCFSTSSHL